MDWQYLAGFTDGEGWIGWSEGREKDRGGRGARMIWGQKTKAPLDEIEVFLKEAGCNNPRLYQTPAYGERGIEMWMLAVSNCHDVRIVLLGLIPHLIVKKGKAEFVLEKLETVTRNYTPLDMDEIHRLHEDGGYTTVSIAKMMRCGRRRIVNALHEMNIHPMGGGAAWETTPEGYRRRLPYKASVEERAKDTARKQDECPLCGGVKTKRAKACRVCYGRLRHDASQFAGYPNETI